MKIILSDEVAWKLFFFITLNGTINENSAW